MVVEASSCQPPVAMESTSNRSNQLPSLPIACPPSTMSFHSSENARHPAGYQAQDVQCKDLTTYRLHRLLANDPVVRGLFGQQCNIDAYDDEDSETIPLPSTRSIPTVVLLQNPTPSNMGEFSWRVGLIASTFNLMVIALAITSANPRVGRGGNLALAMLKVKALRLASAMPKVKALHLALALPKVMPKALKLPALP